MAWGYVLHSRKSGEHREPEVREEPAEREISGEPLSSRIGKKVGEFTKNFGRKKEERATPQVKSGKKEKREQYLQRASRAIRSIKVRHSSVGMLGVSAPSGEINSNFSLPPDPFDNPQPYVRIGRKISKKRQRNDYDVSDLLF